MYVKRNLKFRFFFLLLFTYIDQSRSTSKLDFSFYSNAHHMTLNGIVFLSLFTSVVSLKKRFTFLPFLFFYVQRKCVKREETKNALKLPAHMCMCMGALKTYQEEKEKRRLFKRQKNAYTNT
jgi:hypothetical protein